jgi:hypothetical protein
LNPGRRGGKPATNRLSYGAALSYYLSRKILCACSAQNYKRLQAQNGHLDILNFREQ